MTTDRCDRVWQVEALDDGRLESKDRASFERHASMCAACSAELVRFREIREIMSEAPTAERTDLERRRARIALLGAANQRVVERQAPSRKIRVWALAAALPLLGLSGAALAHYSSARAASGFEVVNVAQADWSANKSGTTSRVTLRAGVASFHVEHVATDARFFVMLPDGEIEVRGTRFVVDVAGARTRSVLVMEGVVALRIGGAEHVLHPGERWQRISEAGSASAAGTPLAQPVELAVPDASGRAVSPTSSLKVKANDNLGAALVAGTPRPSSARGVSSASASKASAGVIPPASARSKDELTVGVGPTAISAGARFAEAVAAFGAGDYGRADALFGDFARDVPNDSRAEDAAFLRADARARRGDKVGATAAARAYLRAYPNGLRHPAAERLAEDH
ncbi:MAG: FecR domain-containing protein [Polyangiaceae bacterium]